MVKFKISLVSILLMALIFSSTVVSSQLSSNDKEIIIDIPSRKLFLLENKEIIKEYPVAVGKSNTQTPVGHYKVISKIIDPYYQKLNIPGGSLLNPLGSRWIGFKKHYGIHGNSDPDSIGTFASAGCVRMYEMDVQELFNSVSYNVPITIQYELIKVLRDTDGENPILLIHPDYYNYGIGINSEIDTKLKDLKLYNSISKERLATLKKQAKDEVTVISDNYTFFVNDTYMTKDVIRVGEDFYINKSKFEKFFNVKMKSIHGENYCTFNEDKIREIDRNGKLYIAVVDLENVFGGKHQYNDVDKSVKFYLENYILLNGSLIRGKGFAVVQFPIVPLNDLIDPLNINLKISSDKVKFMYEGIELKSLYYNNEPYISLKDLEEIIGVDNNINTSKKFIELYSDPVVIYCDTIFKSIRENNEILIPLSIFTVEFINKDIETLHDHIINIGRLETFKRGNKSYVRLSDVLEMEGYEITRKDSYSTKIYLEKRTF